MTDDKQTVREWMIKRHMEIVHLIERLDRIEARQDRIKNSLDNLHLDFEKHRVEMQLKAGLWGLLAGAVPAAVVILGYVIKTAIT